MAEAAKVEVTTREALLAIGLVFMVLIALALAQTGIITNPMTVGLMITLTIGLIFVGHFMARAQIISRGALPLWYIFTFGVVMLVYGGIASGYIPVAFMIAGASIHEIAITNSLFYTLVILSVVAAVAIIYAGYRYYKKRAVGMI